MISIRAHWSRPIQAILKNSDKNQDASKFSLQLTRRKLCSLCQRLPVHKYVLNNKFSVRSSFYSVSNRRSNPFNKHPHQSIGLLEHGSSATAFKSTSSTNRASVSLNKVTEEVDAGLAKSDEDKSDYPAAISSSVRPGTSEWNPVKVKASQLPAIYASLSKSRLTGLVVASAVGGYFLCPLPLTCTSLTGVLVGTTLISASANTTNQILEVPYDAQMKRTSNRVLVKGLISPLHAASFAAVCGASGVVFLYSACNPLTAALGFTNLILYTSLYTPMKRATIANTWMGAVVGAIPPLMGWCGSSGVLLGQEAWGAWLIAGVLFAWQFPHFNALSWNLRPDYSKAGYRMMCVTNPRLCKATCVRYSLMLLGIGLVAPALEVTTWNFTLFSTPLNAYMLYLSYRFYKDGDSRSSRNLFKFSLVHLPAVMLLMIMSKKYSAKSDDDSPSLFTDHYISKVLNNKSFPRSFDNVAMANEAVSLKDNTLMR